jgi:hypothetical protein
MTNLLASLIRPWYHAGRFAVTASILAAPLAIALALASGCYCPEPHHARPFTDSPKHNDATKAQLAAAESKKLWTGEDEQAFRSNLSQLSPETRLAFAKRLATLINSKAVKIDRTPPKTPEAPLCPCGTCNGATTQASPPDGPRVPEIAAPPRAN